VRGFAFRAQPEATARASHSDASDALAGRRELERSGSRRPEERSDGGLAPGGQRRRGTARAIRRGVERSETEQPRAHAGRDAA